MISTQIILGLVIVLATTSFIHVDCHQNHQQPPVYQDGSQAPQDHHAQLNINKEHVMEHLDGIINKPKEQMTVDEQNFYYFKLHDYNNDNKLDGLELVSAFAHTDEHGNPEQHANDPNNPTTPPPIPQRMSDQELIKVIDEILLDEDKDKDGFITYHEFLMAIRS